MSSAENFTQCVNVNVLYWQHLSLAFSRTDKNTTFFLVWCLTLVLLNPVYPAFANSVDPDQLASEEANWSGSALFVIKYMNLYQQSRSKYLIGWKIEVGLASQFIQQDKG